MFSGTHIISIIISLGSIIFLLHYYNKKDVNFTKTTLKIIAIILFFLNPLNWLYEIFLLGSVKLSLNLPLHLCSLYWYLFPLAVFLKKDSTLRQICLASCATLGIIGGLLGLLMNQHLNLNSFISFPVLRSITYHYLMIFSSLLLWTKGIYSPKKLDKYINYIPVIALVIICCIVEISYGYEYCYVKDGAGTPLTIVSSLLPRPLYVITLYLGLYLFIRLVFYNKFTQKFLKI